MTTTPTIDTRLADSYRATTRDGRRVYGATSNAITVTALAEQLDQLGYVEVDITPEGTR